MKTIYILLMISIWSFNLCLIIKSFQPNGVIYDSLVKSAQEKLYKNITSNYTILLKDEFVLGEMRYNFRCHLNSVQHAKEDSTNTVHLVVTIDSNKDCIVHFINKTDGKWIDNTLGWCYELHEYYYIKEIPSSDYNKIGSILDEYQKKFSKQSSSWLLRLIATKTIC